MPGVHDTNSLEILQFNKVLNKMCKFVVVDFCLRSGLKMKCSKQLPIKPKPTKFSYREKILNICIKYKLLALYHEYRSLIGYATRFLFCYEK